MTETVLELSTLAPIRKTVRITSAKLNEQGLPLTDESGERISETELYEMRDPDELSLTDQQWFMGRAEALYRLGVDAEETDESALLLRQALDKIMVDLPPGVAEQLPRPQRWRMVAVFLMPFVDELMPVIESAKGTRMEGLIPSPPTSAN